MFNYSKLPDTYVDRKSQVVKKKSNISIVTPFYNAGDTLMQTVNSVLSQTYPYFEWIIVDDGSKDKKSLKELEKVSKLDDRIKVYHKENGGPSQARDFGIAKASKDSKYIYFLDADDMIDKTMVECLYFALESHKDASFAYTAMANFGSSEFIWDKYLTVEKEIKENLICISSMVRKEDLLEVGCFEIKEKAMYEDWNLWLKLIAAGKKPLRINAPLFWYRTSNTGELSRALDNHEKAMKYVNETISKIKKPVEIIQFPRIGNVNSKTFEWKDITYPQYKNNKKKNILFLIPWMVIGGADLFNLDILKRLDKKKFSTTIITTLPSNNDLRQDFEDYADYVYDLSTFMDRIDYPSFVNYIIKSRNIDTIFLSNSAYGYTMLPLIKKENPKIHVIDYVHSVDPKAKRGGFGGYSRDFDNFVDMTYTCNNFTTNQLRNDFGKKDVETLYIGTDHIRFDSKKYNKGHLLSNYNIPKDKIVISYIARFSEEKRPELFVKIAKELLKQRKDLYFVMAGDGDLKKNVEKLISKYSLKSQFLLTGPTNTPEEIYAISDITINCSRLEGLALTSYESLSMGVPVVSADVGGQKELIDDTVGKIVPYDKNISRSEETKNYVEAIIYALDNLNELKKNSRDKITKKFNLNLAVKKLEDIFVNVKSKPVIEGGYEDLIYDLYINMLTDEYRWHCHMFTMENYGISMYDELTDDPNRKISKKKIIKKKLIDFCYRYDIKNEAEIIVNFIRNIISFIRSFIYMFIYGLKTLLAAPKIIFKFIKKKSEIKELVKYISFGILTTIVSLLTYYVLTLELLNPNNALELQVANVISWILSMSFAYIVNKLFVFNNKNKNILKQYFLFAFSRMTTLLIDMLFMFILVTVMQANDRISKVLVQFIIVITNYMLSKFVIFKR